MASRSQHQASSSYPTPPLTASRSYIGAKAKEILLPNDITPVTRLVTNICYGKEREESDESSKLLYETFTQHFPHVVAVKLLRVYRFATEVTPKIRSFSLNLLDTLLINLDESKVSLKKDCLRDIKILLNESLFQQETSDHDFKLLSRIISRVAVDVFMASNPWEELCVYIIWQNFNRKSLLIFKELPMLLDEAFLIQLLEYRIDSRIVNMLSSQDSDDEEWCLALEAAFSLMLQLVNLGKKSLVWDMVYLIANSIREMVNVRRREIVVRKGLIKIARKVRREALRFRKPEYEVVSLLGMMIQKIDGFSKVTEMIVKFLRGITWKVYGIVLGLINECFVIA